MEARRNRGAISRRVPARKKSSAGVVKRLPERRLRGTAQGYSREREGWGAELNRRVSRALCAEPEEKRAVVGSEKDGHGALCEIYYKGVFVCEEKELIEGRELVEESWWENGCWLENKTSREESRVFGVDRRTVERTRPVGVRDRVFGVDRRRTRARESTCRRDTSDTSGQPFATKQGKSRLPYISFFFLYFIWELCESVSVRPCLAK